MPISSITTADTFGLLVTRTSQLITGYNNLEANGAVTASLNANAAFLHANTAFIHANSAYANGNNTLSLLQTTAIHANSAFDKANNALKNTTDTFTGTLTVIGDIVGKTASNTNTTVIRISTGTEFRTGTSRSTALAPADVFDAAAEVSVADGTTITFDLSTGFNFNVNLTARATRSIATPTNMKPGQSGYIRIKQGAAAQTATYGPGWVFSGGIQPSLSTGTGNTDLLFYQVLSTANVFGSLSRDVRLNY